MRKIGDTVIIDLNNETRKKIFVLPQMLKYSGKSAKIVNAVDNGYILDIDDGSFFWLEEFFIRKFYNES